MQIFKEDPDVIGVGKTRSRRGIFADTAEELFAEGRQCLQYFPHFCDIVNILLGMIIAVLSIHDIRSPFSPVSLYCCPAAVSSQWAAASRPDWHSGSP